MSKFARYASPEEVRAWELKDKMRGDTYTKPVVADIGNVHPALQGLEAFMYTRPTNVAGVAYPNENGHQRMYINEGSQSWQHDPMTLMLHEGEHLRSYRSGTSKAREYAINTMHTPPTRILDRKILDNLDLLRKKYPGLDKIAYFSPEYIKKYGYDIEELLTELSAQELKTGKFLTADPELRKALFEDDPHLMEAYNSISNWRTTRYDARDPAPYKYREDLVPSFFEGLVNKIKGK